MSQPTNIDAFLEGRAYAIRQANREMHCRQLLSALDPQPADQDLDYGGILQRVQAVVTQELAGLEMVPVQVEEGTKSSEI